MALGETTNGVDHARHNLPFVVTPFICRLSGLASTLSHLSLTQCCSIHSSLSTWKIPCLTHGPALLHKFPHYLQANFMAISLEVALQLGNTSLYFLIAEIG